MRQARRQLEVVWMVAVIVVATLGMAATAPGDAPLPTASTASATPGIPYWQARALPATVIQGGAIPPGWQPQALPYQGIGPDGRPLTMYFAPTYVFTYQSGSPVAGAATVGRPQAWGGSPAAAGGWNYRTSGAQPVPVTLPPSGAPWGAASQSASSAQRAPVPTIPGSEQ